MAISAVSQSPIAIFQAGCRRRDRADRRAIGAFDKALDIGVAAMPRQQRRCDQHEQERRRKMPMVETTEPQKPRRDSRRSRGDERPGLIMPIATAIRNCRSSSQPNCCTSPCSRNGTITSRCRR